MGLLDVKNLSFKYDNQIEKVFDNVSFQIDTNWKLGLIGRNGKGKTTLLELLMSNMNIGLYYP
ncbi:MAG: ATP-binding cassette domain-containing protein [Thomasclavelia ramosa]